MALRLIVPPTSEPVTLGAAKNFLRLDAGFTQDDALITSLIAGARRWAETYTQRRFIRQTWRLLMDFFPGYVDFKLAGQRVSSPFVSGSNAVLVGIRYAIALPYPPVAQIVAFQYQDQNGNPVQMIAATDYIQDLQSQPARLMPLFGSMWPVARVVANAVQVDYRCGYGETAKIGIAASSKVITGYVFAPTDVGTAVSIPGAGSGTPAGVLNTTIASVDANGNGTTADAASTTVSGVSAYVGEPVPDAIQTAILMAVNYSYEKRMPADENVPGAIKALLGPYRDLRL